MRVLDWPGKSEPSKRIRVRLVAGAGSYSCAEHRHNGYWEMTYVLDGELQHRLNGEPLTQRAGDLALLRLQDRHALAGDRVSYVNLAFSTAVVDGVLGESLSRPGDRVHLLRNRPTAFTGRIPEPERGHFERCLNHLMVHADPAAEIPLFCQVFFAALCRGIFPALERTPSRRRLPEWLVECLQRLDRYPDVAVTLPDLAADCGRSREHVSRSFRAFLGVPPGTYLNRRHLDTAAGLLARTNLPIAEIARRTGFGNMTYFYKLFRARFGEPPRRFRLSHMYSELP